MKKRHHSLPDLMAAGADLLDVLDGASGLSAGFHVCLPVGLRILVQDGRPYTDEVGPLDRISATIGSGIKHERFDDGGHAETYGTWNETAVEGSHLYFDRPLNDDPPCTHTAAQLAGRIRAMLPWARQDWTRFVESVRFFDRNGLPQIHVALIAGDAIEQARSELLDATSLLQRTSMSQDSRTAFGEALLADGTVVSVSSLDS